MRFISRRGVRGRGLDNCNGIKEGSRRRGGCLYATIEKKERGPRNSGQVPDK